MVPIFLLIWTAHKLDSLSKSDAYDNNDNTERLKLHLKLLAENGQQQHSRLAFRFAMKCKISMRCAKWHCFAVYQIKKNYSCGHMHHHYHYCCYHLYYDNKPISKIIFINIMSIITIICGHLYFQHHCITIIIIIIATTFTIILCQEMLFLLLCNKSLLHLYNCCVLCSCLIIDCENNLPWIEWHIF